MIILSGGHYPKAKGAVHNGRGEYPRTYEWAIRVGEILDKEYGIESIVVPTGPLPDKMAYINTRRKMCVAIEIHFNSSPGGKGHGSETLYYPGSREGKVLAETIQMHLGYVATPNRGVKEGWYRMDRPGVIDYDGDVDGDETPDYFLRKTKCPAVIVEPAFIQDEDLILSHKEDFCKAIARGIYDYVRE